MVTQVFLCRAFGEDFDEAAIKVYLKRGNEGLSIKFFERECEVLERLRHPNIVHLYDKGFDDENEVFFIVLEFVDGEGLDEVIKKNNLTKEDKEKVVEQIFDALEYAHNQGVLHRDLKTANIMLDRNNCVKLIDFGISKIINALSEQYTLVQSMTMKYASPEQKLGKALDYASDIYSLGIVLYELLGNKELENEQDIKEAIENSTLISKNYKIILEKMTEEDRGNRYNNIYEVRRDWRKAQDIGSKFYKIQLTTNAINTLKECGIIDENCKQQAKCAIARDLEGDTYIAKVSAIYPNNSGEAYFVFGKQLRLQCVVDRKDNKSFTITAINIPDTFFMEKNKEECGMLVNYSWRVDGDGSEQVHIENLLTSYKEYILKKNTLECVSKNSDELYSKWDIILNIYKENNKKAKQTLRYNNLKYDSINRRIYVNILNQIDVCPFNEEDLLVMTVASTKYRQSFRTQRIGYYNDFKEGILEIDLLREVDVENFSKSGEVAIDTAYIDSLIDKQENALNTIKKNKAVNENLKKLLLQPSQAKARYFAKEIRFANKHIDESKEDAILDALAARDIYLLQGPPGTGKTTFISELVYQALEQSPKAKILISSQSNVAVNHAMNKIKELMPDISMVRLGRQEKIGNGIENYFLDLQLDEWIEEIKERCEAYFLDLKNRNFNNEIQEKYYLVEEIMELKKQLTLLEQVIYNMEKELFTLEDRYREALSYKADIDQIINRLNNLCHSPDKKEVDVVKAFKDQYVKIGNKFIDNVAEAGQISRQKDDVEVKLVSERNKKIQVQQELEAGIGLLNISTDDELSMLKNELDKKLESMKRKLDQYKKYENIKKDWLKSISRCEELDKLYMEQVSLIGATCIGIANYADGLNLVFDLVIIDEAGRATPPELMVPMCLGKKIVLVGDHKQLPPIIDQVVCNEVITQTDYNRNDLEESLFAYLEKSITEDCKGTLNRQYRMNPNIGNLISTVFYEGEITSGITYEQRRHGYSEWEEKSIIWIDTKNNKDKWEQEIKTTKQNQLEADIIFTKLVELEEFYEEKGLSSKEIGIIAGYSGQKNLLIRLYKSKYSTLFKRLKIEIDTVDAFQGRETDIIIYSIVRSNQQGDIGFLSDTRRLNVALSRARELLILVGDSESVTLKKQVANPFLKVYEFVNKNSNLCEIVEV